MRGMSEAYEKLIPYMFSDKKYKDPNQKKFIELYLKQLNENASGLDKHVARGLSGDDPLFSKGLAGVKKMIQRASESYYGESYEYSQKLLQASIKYCSTCHMRTHRGPTFKKWDNFEDVTAKWSANNFSQYLVATRQFEKASIVMEKGLATEKIQTKEAEQLMKRLVALYLKNLRSPEKALKVLEDKSLKARFTKLAPKMNRWRQYLKKNQNKKINTKKLLSLYNSKAPHFAEAVVVSRDIHQNISTYLDPLKRAESFFILGKVYQKHKELGFWNLDESYFEACIQELPGSKLATKCYYQIEKQQFQNSKSFTSTLNELERTRLKTLKRLATQSPETSFEFSSSGAGAEDD